MARIDGPATHAADLRTAFDAAFAVPFAVTAAATIDVLAVQAANAYYAVPVREISAVLTDRPVTPLPGSLPELLGVAEVRGTVMPIYDLGSLLTDAPTGWPQTPPRWVLAAGGPVPLGLAFHTFEGHLRIRAAEVGRAAADEPASAPTPSDCLTGGALVNGRLRPIISVPALLSRIAARVGTRSRAAGGGS